MRQHFLTARVTLSSLPTWLKWLITANFLIFGAAQGFLAIYIAHDLVRLSEFINAISQIPNKGVFVAYLQAGLDAGFWMEMLYRLLIAGNLLGFVLMVAVWWRPRNAELFDHMFAGTNDDGYKL